MRRMLTAKLQNRSGVLNRFTGVLSRRQVNIESISVGASEDPNVSRITIIIDVNSQNEVEQIIKQLNRQIDVIRIRDITDQPHLEREVILVKVSAPTSKRAEILAIIQPFRASVVGKRRRLLLLTGLAVLLFGAKQAREGNFLEFRSRRSQRREGCLMTTSEILLLFQTIIALLALLVSVVHLMDDRKKDDSYGSKRKKHKKK